MRMYVWSVKPTFLAVSQAECVESARRALLNEQELGESGDGSCPERDEARKFILTTNPTIWHGVNVEFALTDSAELRELEQYLKTKTDRIAQLEAELLAAKEDTARMDWMDKWVADIRYSGDDLDRCDVRGWQPGGQIRRGQGHGIRSAIDAARGAK